MLAFIEKAGYEKESKTIFDILLFFIINGRYTVPEVIDSPRYNMIVAGKRDTTRNSSRSIMFSSTQHVKSRKLGLLLGQGTAVRVGVVVKWSVGLSLDRSAPVAYLLCGMRGRRSHCYYCT